MCLGLLASCSSTPPAPPPPVQKPIVTAPPVVKTVVPAVPADWQDRAASAGDWTYRQDGKGSIALFGQSGADARFAIRCDGQAKRIYLTHPGQFPAGESGKMTVRASTSMKTFDAANTGGSPALVGVTLDPREPQLDAIAFSRGTFLVSIKGTADLILPAWPEVARVVEDCRA